MWFVCWLACTSEPDPEPVVGDALPLRVGTGEVPRLALAPDGALYVAWAERSPVDAYTRAYVGRVDLDREEVVGIQVSQEGYDVVAGWPEGPSLAVGDTRVVVGMGTVDRNDIAVHAFVADRDDLRAERVFTSPLPSGWTQISFPEVGMSPDGEAWMAWLLTPDATGHLHLAGDGNGWQAVDLNDQLGVEPPCECCPIRLRFRESGEMLLAWRGDVAKEIFLAWGPPDAPATNAVQATASGVRNEICPLDGPDVIEADGRLQVAWSDTLSGEARGFLSVEGADGTFSTTQVAPEAPLPQTRLQLAGSGAEQVVAWDEVLFGSAGYHVKVGDGEPTWLEGPTGRLFEVDLLETPDGVLAVGVDAEGVIWLVAP